MIENIVEKVAHCLVTAASSFREDQKEAYRRAVASEPNAQSCWVMKQVLENALVAERSRRPGAFTIRLPKGVKFGFYCHSLYNGNDIKEGIREGLRRLPGRPMAIKGDEDARLDQSGGLDTDPGALAPAPFILKPVDEEVVRLTVLMLGGGPAIRGITQRVFHKHSVDTIVSEIVSRATEGVKALGCSPCVLAVGIGRSQFEATSLMIEAMAKGDFNVQSPFEQKISSGVNVSNIGPLGLGGCHSVLATFAKVGPQRASGVRVVALRPCCCFEPRRSSVEL